jgi:hypothetical protein
VLIVIPPDADHANAQWLFPEASIPNDKRHWQRWGPDGKENEP